MPVILPSGEPAVYSIKKYSLLENLDFSDYVTAVSDVPYYGRERDYSLLAEGYNFKLSINCDIELAKDDRVLFYRNDVLIHHGVIDLIVLNESELIYNITVRHLLTELQKRNSGASIRANTPQTFMKQMLDASSVVTLDSIDHTLISLTDLINTIIGEVAFFGVGLDWTETNYFNASFQYDYPAYKLSDGLIHNVSNISYSKFYFLPEQINCINQNGVFSPANIATDDRDANRINLFDLLSLLCSVFGLGFIPKTDTVFYVVNVRDTMPSDYIEDDNLYDIETTEELKQAEGVSLSYKTCPPSLLLSSVSGAAWSSASVLYEVNTFVTYGGKTWVCVVRNTSHANSYPGNTNPAYFFMWVEVSVTDAGDYYVSDGETLNGDNANFYREYIGLNGINPKALNWYDNFDIIINDSGAGYIAQSKNIGTTLSPARYQIEAALNNYTKKIMTTEAAAFIDTLLYNVESIKIIDTGLDLVEVETEEII